MTKYVASIPKLDKLADVVVQITKAMESQQKQINSLIEISKSQNEFSRLQHLQLDSVSKNMLTISEGLKLTMDHSELNQKQLNIINDLIKDIAGDL